MNVKKDSGNQEVEIQDLIELQKIIDIKPKDFKIYLPEPNFFLWPLLEFKLACCQAFRLKINYFTIRHKCPMTTKRLGDLGFLLYYLFDLLPNNNATFLEKFYYQILIRSRYFDEIKDWNNLQSKEHKTKKEKQILELYEKNYIDSYRYSKQNDFDWYH